MNSIELLNQRVSKDYNLPINIYEKDMFDYYRKLYHFFPQETYETLVENVNTMFSGNVEEWLGYCAKFRDSAIEGVMATDVYKNFNTSSMDKYDVYGVPRETRTVYSQETDGKTYVSIDLRKANFQALKFVGVIDDDSYKDFVMRFGGDDYIADSKYLRQVVFGKMNPARTVKVEKFIMSKVYKLIHEEMEGKGYEFFSFDSDELIFKEGAPYYLTQGEIEKLIRRIHDMVGVDVRIEPIKIKRLDIVNARGNSVDAYVRHNLLTGEEVLKKASTTFYPQIYKLWKGMEIEEIDRQFFFEYQICTFNKPLILR